MAEKDIRKGWKPFELKAVIAQKTEQLASKDARIKELEAQMKWEHGSIVQDAHRNSGQLHPGLPRCAQPAALQAHQ